MLLPLLGLLSSCGTPDRVLTVLSQAVPGLEQKLKSPTPLAYERSATDVDIADGVAVVGSVGGAAGEPVAGRAYAFSWNGTSWIDGDELGPPVLPASYGRAVATDGSRVVVGAPSADGTQPNAGAAFVFSRNGSGWRLESELAAKAPLARSYFGSDVAVNGDTIAVSAPGSPEGAVHVFELSSDGWSEVAQLKAPAGDGGARRFGSAIALGAEWLAVGAPAGEDSVTGAVFLFRRSNGTWQPASIIEAHGTEDRFASAVALDRQTLLVGAPAIESEPVVHAFRWDGVEWQEDGILRPDQDDSFHFGAAVAVTGEIAVVGAPGSAVESAASAGKAYLYSRRPDGWHLTTSLTLEEGRSDDAFGASLALDGDRILIGATGDDEAAPDSGAAYLFRLLRKSESER